MEKKDVFKYIFKQLKVYKFKIIIIFFCMLIIAILGVISPLLQEKLFDKGIMARSMDDVIWYTILLAVIFIIEKIFDFIQFVQSEYINKQLPYTLLYDTICHSLDLKISYYKDNNFSKIINNTYKDISEITEIVNTSILESLISVFKIIGGIIGLFIINWKLTIFILMVIPIEVLVSSIFSNKRQKLNEKMLKYNENFAVWLSETFNSMEILKLWSLQNRRRKEFINLQAEMIKTETKMDYLDTYSDVASSTINIIFTYGLNLLGAFFIFGNELTVGGLFAFSAYSVYVMQPMAILASIIYKFSSGYPSIERFLKYFQNEVESEEGVALIDASINSIVFDNVIFGYENKEPILNGVSFDIKQGEKVAFIGCNGSGKSTILNLLLRFFMPDFGEISINGTKIQEFSLGEYRKLFSVMNQNLFLFEDSIKNNINIENELSDSEIKKYLDLLNAKDFITSLPEGINTRVGYNGTKLSGGEKQKVVLARTLCRKAPILILDEATASFDINAEKQFDKYINETNRYEIIMVVSHRVDILKVMDKIFVLDKGKIVDSGTFEELEKRNSNFLNILKEEREKENE